MHRLAAVLAAPVLLLAACGVDVIEIPLSFDLPISGPLDPSGRRYPGADQIGQQLDNQGVERGQVDSVTLTELTLLHVSPAGCEGLVGCDLSFVERLEVRVSAPELPEITVGVIESPGATRRAELTIEPVELEPYVTAETMEVTLRPLLSSQPVQAVELRLTATLRADLNVL